MDRRTLLKAIPALVGVPVIVGAEEVGKAFKIEEGSKYVIFLNASRVDAQDFARTCTAFPSGTPIYAVDPTPDMGMDETVRIYKT